MKFALQLAVTTGRYLRLVIRAKLSLLLIIESIDSHIIYFSSQTLKKNKDFVHTRVTRNTFAPKCDAIIYQCCKNMLGSYEEHCCSLRCGKNL